MLSRVFEYVNSVASCTQECTANFKSYSNHTVYTSNQTFTNQYQFIAT